MRTTLKAGITIGISIGILVACIGIGSVSIPIPDMLTIIKAKISMTTIPKNISPSMVSILWDIRMPRALTAFIVGALLSVSGVIMQSLLQNPLASSYTLGVSSGAALGVALVVVCDIVIPVVGMFLLPAAGFVFGLGTVLLVIAFAKRLDASLKNQTIILLGMVFSLFVNAVLTLVSAMNAKHLQRLSLWQMGSFAGRRWMHVGILLGVAIPGIVAVLWFHRELDLMSFGEEQSQAVGVDTRKTKLRLLMWASLLTGAAVCFTGIIGFVDLTMPHVTRKVFGARHGLVIPMSALLGGSFLALADLLSRTLLAPREIPVGAVTALVGAPFFLYLYFLGRKGKPSCR
ncbi:iron complex transport system permease protein [Lachnospiraceae bacterium XBB1006]|nr:iron complex transport system permease protein [Lachnospiraceae bacterium XBB1006]